MPWRERSCIHWYTTTFRLMLHARERRRSEERRGGEGGRFECEWSSDVCSSDLIVCMRIAENAVAGTELYPLVYDHFQTDAPCTGTKEIGRAAWRGRGEI